MLWNRSAKQGRVTGHRPGARRTGVRQIERLEARTLLAADLSLKLASSPWHNAFDKFDVNNDHRVTVADALYIIQDLRTNGSHAVPTAGASGQVASAMAISPQASAGATSGAATRMVDVNNDGKVSTMDAMLVIRRLQTASQEVSMRLAVTDLSGNPLTNNQIVAGTDFQLRAFVQDIRPTDPDPSPTVDGRGVASAFLNVGYNPSLVTLTVPPSTVQHSTAFPDTPSGDATIVGQINEAGGQAADLFNPNGPTELPLFTVNLHAAAPGDVTFVASGAQNHDTILYEPTNANSDILVDPTTQIEFINASLTIVAPPQPTIAIVSPPATKEGNSGTTPFVFNVNLSSPSVLPITVNFNTADGTATLAENDYQTNSGTLTFAPGETTKQVTVLVNGDTTFEADETFRLQLTNAVNATLPTPASGTATILNDDVGPSISVGNVSLPEGNSGTTTFAFPVTLSTASATPVTIDYTTTDGTATTADGDYQAAKGTVTFAAGQTTQTINVLVNGDTKNEADETFNINFSNASGAAAPAGPAIGTIQNDDALPALTITPPLATNEGNSGTTAFTFQVNLSAAGGQPVTVNFGTIDGTATLAEHDYQAATGSLTFAAGETSKTITVLVNGDTLNEPDETFQVALSGAVNASLPAGPATATILNDDAVPTLSVANVSKAEGNSGVTTFPFIVTLSAASAQTVTVDFATADGTATVANNDYLPKNGTLSFAPGETSKEIDVSVLGDTTFEPNETFSLNFTNATNANPPAAAAIGTILNDDNVPALSVANVSHSEGNSGTTAYTFNVNLSAATTVPVTVDFSTADGTATIADNDYQANKGTLTFQPGVTSQSITVLVNGDTKFEDDETFTVNFSNAVNATLPAGPATGTIVNDDAPPTVSIADFSHNEGDSGFTPFTFNLTLSQASGKAVTVNFATANGTATAPNDYTAQTGVVTFNPGETTKTITVQVKGDIFFEQTETFTVALSLPANANATIARGTATGTIVNDDPVGNFQPSSFAGVVYIDANQNGAKDLTEKPLAGATVHLTGTDQTGASVDTTVVTGSDGSYLFDNLTPGSYEIQDTPPTTPIKFNSQSTSTPNAQVAKTDPNGSSQTAAKDAFFITFTGGMDLTDNNFGVTLDPVSGVGTGTISKRGFLGSVVTPPTSSQTALASDAAFASF